MQSVGPMNQIYWEDSIRRSALNMNNEGQISVATDHCREERKTERGLSNILNS